MAFLQGFFKPKNPKKYKGNPNNIIYRSSYELKCMMFFDSNPSILEWQSEENFLGYVNPIDNKFHKYYYDFLIKKKDKNGNIKIVMIEVKPAYQTVPPVRGKNQSEKSYIREVEEWGRNSGKWEYARKYCEKKGWEFMIITENDLGIKS